MESTPRQEAKEEADSIAAAFAYVAASRKRDVGNLGGKENEVDSNSTEPAAKQARKDDSDSSTASRGGKSKPPRIPHKTTNPEPSSARKSSSSSSTSVAAITPISARKGGTVPNTGSNSTGKDEQQEEAGRRDENKENNQKLSPSASAASTRFSAKREDTSMVLSSIPLPSQIPNIFASTPSNMATRTTTSCQCCSTGRHPDHPCFGGQCNSVNYLQTYGWEYRTLLRLKETEEYEPYLDYYEKDSSAEDPLLPLTVSGIVPPREKRRRQMTDWFHPHASQGWDLDDYMDRQPDLAPRMRSILIDWMVELTEEYKLSPNTFHLAVTLVDKSLACAKDGDDYLYHDEDEDDEDTDDQDSKADGERGLKIPRDMLQCLGCACTWIAAKIEEVTVPTVNDFVYISDNIYSQDQIREMEMDVCATLKFRLQHVTPVAYAHEFLMVSEKAPCNNGGPSFHPILRNMVYYLLELSRFPYALIPVKPSLVAAGAIFLARATLGICDTSPANAAHARGYWTKALQYYTGYSVEELRDTVRIIHEYQRDSESSSLKAIFRKYNKAKFMFVSARTSLNEEDLTFSCFMSNHH